MRFCTVLHVSVLQSQYVLCVHMHKLRCIMQGGPCCHATTYAC